MSNLERVDALSSHNPAHLAPSQSGRTGQMRTGAVQPRPLPIQKNPVRPQAQSAEASSHAEAGEPGHQASDPDGPVGSSVALEAVSHYPTASLADLQRGAALGWHGVGPNWLEPKEGATDPIGMETMARRSPECPGRGSTHPACEEDDDYDDGDGYDGPGGPGGEPAPAPSPSPEAPQPSPAPAPDAPQPSPDPVTPPEAPTPAPSPDPAPGTPQPNPAPSPNPSRDDERTEDGTTVLPPITITPDRVDWPFDTDFIWTPGAGQPWQPGAGSVPPGAFSAQARPDGSYVVRDSNGKVVATLSPADVEAIERQGISVPEFLGAALDHPDVQPWLNAAAAGALVMAPFEVPLGLAVGLIIGGVFVAGYLIFDGDRKPFHGPMVNVPPPPPPETPPYSSPPVDVSPPAPAPNPDIPDWEEYPIEDENPSNIVFNRPSEPSLPVPDIPEGWDGTTPPAEGWIWKGDQNDVGGPHGAWESPDRTQSLHADPNHGPPLGPHIDWNIRRPPGTPTERWRIFPDGRVEPK